MRFTGTGLFHCYVGDTALCDHKVTDENWIYSEPMDGRASKQACKECAIRERSLTPEDLAALVKARTDEAAN